MATTSTTLAGALRADDWFVSLASQANLKAGDSIVCEQESMRVLVVGTGNAIVYRGARGTAGKAHASGTAATYGAPTDYGVGVGVASFQIVETEAAEAPTPPPAE